MTFQYPAVSRRNLMKSVVAAGLLANFSKKSRIPPLYSYGGGMRL